MLHGKLGSSATEILLKRGMVEQFCSGHAGLFEQEMGRYNLVRHCVWSLDVTSGRDCDNLRSLLQGGMPVCVCAASGFRIISVHGLGL
jgi:hypothetical protein